MAYVDKICSICEKYIEHDDRIRKPFSDIGVCFACSEVTKFSRIVDVSKQIDNKVRRATHYRCWWIFEDPHSVILQVRRSGFRRVNIVRRIATISTTDGVSVFVGSFYDLRKMKRVLRPYLPRDTVINEEDLDKLSNNKLKRMF